MPHCTGLRLEATTIHESHLTLQLASMKRAARCPLCRRRSNRVHSRYRRTIADLPISERSVTLRLQVRRFSCRTRRCPRRIFAEQFPSLVLRYGRRTHAQRLALEEIGFALGGAGGARLATRLRSPVSRTTVLRFIRAAGLPAYDPPRLLGVDDWARRKGWRYGTILVDLEQHRPIDLLPDRTAATLATWLQDHPGIEVISRDRSGAYAEGATRGAPHAVQVADRFHLLKNLGEAVEEVLDRHRGSLRSLHLPCPLGEPPPGGAVPGVGESTGALAPPTPRLRPLQNQHRAERLARYEQVIALRERGLTLRAIARQVGVGARTMQRWLRAGTFPERKPRRRPPNPLAAYADYLTQRWGEGCHNGMQLWREVCAAGYAGPRSPIWEVVQRLRTGASAIAVPVEVPVGPAGSARRPPSPRRVAGLYLRRPADRTEDEQHALGQLLASCPAAKLAYELTDRFTSLVRNQQPDALDPWLATAAACELPELRRFALGIARDKAAVTAAVALPYSNGQTEGQITRLKLVKRAMYGRANFDLLRQRVLRTA